MKNLTFGQNNVKIFNIQPSLCDHVQNSGLKNGKHVFFAHDLKIFCQEFDRNLNTNPLNVKVEAAAGYFSSTQRLEKEETASLALSKGKLICLLVQKLKKGGVVYVSWPNTIMVEHFTASTSLFHHAFKPCLLQS